MTVRLIAALVTVGAFLLPAYANADSGSITNVHLGPDGESVYATYSSTSTTCDESIDFCGWYPHAWEVPASSACSVDKSYLTYVGDLRLEPGTQTGTDFFIPHFNATRICLYISDPFDHETLVADYVYPPDGTAPPPTPALTIAEARSHVPRVLRDEFGRRYTRRKGALRRSCYRFTVEKVRCRVSWKTTRYRYSGNVTLWNDRADPAEKFMYRVNVHRKRRRSSPGPGSLQCDPNYAGACLEPNASDYDCAGGTGDGPRYTGPVRVVGNDHYDLDRDGDGYACDT